MSTPESDMYMNEQSEKAAVATDCKEILFDGNDSGFGYGSGMISRKRQLETGELTAEADNIACEYLQTHPEAFVAIDADAPDDGCGDGRKTGKIFQYTVVDGEQQLVEFHKSRNRAKVFGGGIVMTEVAQMATLTTDAKTSEGLLAGAVGLLDEKHIQFGAHTDEHAQGDNCGCGAIDKFPVILANITRYNTQIQGTLEKLLGNTFNDSSYSEAFSNINTIFDSIDFSSYSGGKAMEQILPTGAVVKQLSGNHQEDFVVLNFEQGTTLDQKKFFEYTENKAQAFCVDVWRLQKYAEAVSDDKRLQDIALYGMLIFTLATSATLTDGSQRVFVNSPS